ncbi:MAG: hypothetical protein R3C68_03260 [Myxococcota bacterium]
MTKPKTVVAESDPQNIDQETRAKRDNLHLKKFDLDRDQRPDVFKFYTLVDGPKSDSPKTEVLVRKEVDLNHDGLIDVVRIYNDNQEVAEELADFDFDGRFDEHSYYKGGFVIRKELDLDYDGRTDVSKFFAEGQLNRIESDRDGDGRVYTWEYFLNNEIDRIGTDTDGDGKVDKWETKRSAPAEAPQAAPDEDTEDTESTEGEGTVQEPEGDQSDAAEPAPDSEDP